MRAAGRLTELDALRGIAALAVVVFHATENLPDRDLPILRVLRGTPLRPLLDGRQAVIFFFVLSGFALTHALLRSPPGYLAFAARRIVRLCVPALAAVLLSALLFIVFHDGGWPEPGTWLGETNWTASPSFAGIARQATLTGLDQEYDLDCVLWSLAHELRLSLLLPIVVWLAAGRAASWLLPVAGCMLAGIAFGDGATPERLAGTDAFLAAPLWLMQAALPLIVFGWIARIVGLPIIPAAPWTRLGPILLSFLAGFYIGSELRQAGVIMLGSTARLSLLATAYYAPCFLIGAALSLGALARFEPNAKQQAMGVAGAAVLLGFDSLFATTAASLLLIAVALRPGHTRDFLRRAPFVFLGRISFSLYLVHAPLLLAMSHALHGVLPLGAIIALWLPATVPVAWLFAMLVERPAQRLARRVPDLARPEVA